MTNKGLRGSPNNAKTVDKKRMYMQSRMIYIGFDLNCIIFVILSVHISITHYGNKTYDQGSFFTKQLWVLENQDIITGKLKQYCNDKCGLKMPSF